MELLNLGIAKENDSNYNQNEYIDNKLTNKNMMVSGNIVLVDDWMFEIDRSVPEIKNFIGKGSVSDKITINLSQTISEDYSNSVITGNIIGDKNITMVSFSGEEINFTNEENGRCIIKQTVNKNGNYNVLAKDSSDKFQIKNIIVKDLTEDMDIHNKQDLEEFRDKVNNGRSFKGKTVKVMDNIDLELTSLLSWEPINGFDGTFYGNGYEISNLYINSNNEDQGFFGVVKENAKIDGVVIASGEIKGGGIRTGAIAGKCLGNISKCKNNIKVSGGLDMTRRNLWIIN